MCWDRCIYMYIILCYSVFSVHIADIYINTYVFMRVIVEDRAIFGPFCIFIYYAW